MTTPEAEAHLRRLHSFRRQHIDRPRVFQGVLDPAAAAAPLSPNVSDRSYASDRRQRGQQRSRALKKQVDNMLHHAWCVDGSC
mmetsp:Transcript_25116/g.32102  ORF Transcript_25116/g.32102 Transcript_25116/m.32102 type:complete len:83 (+) Transcript_25116:1004-1252(+)